MPAKSLTNQTNHKPSTKSTNLSSDEDTKKRNTVVKKKPGNKKSKLSILGNAIQQTTGGKAPPAIVKEQQQHLQSGPKTSGVQRQKSISKAVASTASAQSKSKKKSIFSSDNSSDSDSDLPKHKNSKVVNDKSKSVGAVKSEQVKRRLSQVKAKVQPAKRLSHSSDSSGSGSSSSSDDSSSSLDSDSESSTTDTPESKKKKADEKKQASETTPKADIKTGSETDNNLNAQKVIRKLTRSSSTRKSKHLTGKLTESDSENENDVSKQQRLLSKSPVKKHPLSKGKGRPPLKNCQKQNHHGSNSVKRAPSHSPADNKCPVDGCDSKGHLGGQIDKHFTIEACPLYHNVTLTETESRTAARKQQDEERTKAIALLDDGKKQTIEQKTYLTKIDSIRELFKPVTSPLRESPFERIREPILNGIVSEYDLRLFQEAQAIAATDIENELKDLPVGKGTKYIIMGNHRMDVWYQSPYPDDVARLPKLYLCEYCLRYQKSEVGMKRHAAKCVWRHPPGDEVINHVQINFI